MNLGSFIPEIVLACFAVLVILLDLFISKKVWLAVISITGLLISAGFAVQLWNESPQSIFYGMLAVDNFSVFFKLLFLGIAVIVILASADYVSRFRGLRGEYYALILIATLGMMLMASTTELISLFLSLELVNLSLYALVGFLKDDRSTEASLKYLLLSATASAVLLFGMALVFGFTGETKLAEIAGSIQSLRPADMREAPALILGIILMLAGFGFKIAMFPLHMWVPDVYEGAPTPVTAFLSVGSKSAGFAIIVRVFSTAFAQPQNLSLDWGMVIAVLAAITMTAGNVIAIQQHNIKRMLGYSSIAQAGYVMVGLAALGFSSGLSQTVQGGILFFLAAYSLSNLGAFIAIIAISNKTGSDNITDFSGTGKRSPLTAAALTICLVSLIGLPPAAGFIAKFYIFGTAVQNDLLWLVVIAVVNSVISAFYYLRVVKYMWMGEPAALSNIESSSGLRIALAVSSLGTLVLFFLPGPLMDLANISAILH